MHRILIALLLAGVASDGMAQDRPAPTVAPHDTTAAERLPHRLSRHGAIVAVGGLALVTAATMPFDGRLAAAVRGPGPQGSTFLHRGARVANAAGGPGAVVASVALYGLGRLGHDSGMTALGLHAGEAVVVASTATAALKLLAGRQRPYVEAGDADDFAPAHGRAESRSSFPSGHTTAAFAFASAVGADLRRAHPHVARVAVPLLYAGATSVGLARMYDNRHWASDVVLGAGIGTLVGTQLGAFSHARPQRWIDRHLGAVSIAPTPGGAGLLLRVDRAAR